MDVIGQDADGNRLERTSIFDLGVGAPQAFDATDEQIAAAVGECEREEERPTFDLKPTIAGHQSLPSRSGGHGLRAFAHPTLLLHASIRTRLCNVIDDFL